jgi:hypothetical protein
MGRRKWFPSSEERVIETERWRYILGMYDHRKYGRGCFRISKFIRNSGYFVGHFVVAPEDQDVVLPEIAKLIDLATMKAELSGEAVESVSVSSADSRDHPLPGIEKEVCT